MTRTFADDQALLTIEEDQGNAAESQRETNSTYDF